MANLIKDQRDVNNLTAYDKIAGDILEKLNDFNEMFNFGDIDAREEGTNRSQCKPIAVKTDDESAKTTERRLCKCLYYTNDPAVRDEKICDKCDLKDRQSEGYHAELAGNFKVVYYEFVPTNKGNGIGNVDLVLADENFVYLTEVKPPKGNSETLLRMFLEIETYYRVTIKGQQYKNVREIGDKPLRKAILFFKDSPQEKAYNDPKKGINTKKLLAQFGIAVLCAEFADGKVWIKAIG